MKVLVTGAAGFIGGHLVERLLERGDEVRALSLPSSDTALLEELPVQLFYGDITDPGSLVASMQGVELVFHAAARVTDWGPWAAFRRETVQGTRNVLSAAIAAGASGFLMTSSVSAYGNPLPRRVLEESRPYGRYKGGLANYGRSKRLAEEAAIQRHAAGEIRVTIVRPSVVYGPRNTLVSKMVKYLKSPLPVWVGSPDHPIPLIDVQDVVEGCIAAAASPAGSGELFNLTNEERVTYRQAIDTLCQMLDLSPPRWGIPRGVVMAQAIAVEEIAGILWPREEPPITRGGVEAMTMAATVSAAKARTLLGWEAKIGLEEGYQRMTAWLKESQLV
ncbi:MAG: NAD-dependent epimerase/dehydratase family protein [Dehalococcoidia bacterium]